MVAPTSYTPARGDIVWISFSPQAGREQAGRRPGLVVSPASYNSLVGLALCCPITSQVKGYPFEVALPDDLAISGVILSDHVRSLDWRARRIEYSCSAPASTIEEVLELIKRLL